MIRIGVRDLKNNLSHYLTSVKKGQVVLITERGRPVARIVQETTKKLSLRERLSPLVAEGFLELPEKDLRKKNLKPVPIKGKSISRIIIEGRR